MEAVIPFPVEVRPDEVDDRGLFLVQDLEIRSKVLPLFRINPQSPNERPAGHGTTFRIDPWCMCATAFHVIEELVEYCETQQNVRIRPDVALAALEFPGIVYGTVAIPRDWWRPLEGMSSSHVRIENRPLQPITIRNLSELAALWISPSPQHKGASEYFDLDQRWTPEIGDQVMALGYADLDVDTHGRGEQRPMEQYVYGSVSEIIELEPPDVERGRPWPMMRVQANWPGGMSGGPVFNTEGKVVGVVSTGFPGHDIATATFFSAWEIPRQTFQSLDPANPGWFYCIGVFDAEERIRWVGPDGSEASRFADDQNLSDVRAISFNPVSQEYITIRRIPPGTSR